MPEWLQILINFLSVIGVGTVIYWSYKLGEQMGKLKQEQKTQDKRMDDLATQMADCPPRQECEQLFREIKTDIGNLNGKMDFVVEHVKRGSS